MEADIRPERELRGESVARHRPRLRQARRGGGAGHRLQQRIVDGVEREIGRDDALGVGGVEARQTVVKPERQGAFGRGERGRREHRDDAEQGDREIA